MDIKSLFTLFEYSMARIDETVIFCYIQPFHPLLGHEYAPSLFSGSPASAGGRCMNFDFPTFYRALTDLVIRISYMVVMY